MKRVFKLISLLSLIFALACSQESELTFPYYQSVIIKTEPVIVRLKYKEAAIINRELNIKFEGVVSDSRCPIDAICIWPGDGEVKLCATTNNSSKEFTLRTDLFPKKIFAGKYTIELKALYPAPKTTVRIMPEDYYVDIIIKKFDEKEPRPVLLIDSNNSGLIKKDMLNVNDVSLEKDIITFSVGYSGGCADHFIDLFAYREIAKSNPAQVTLNLSHDLQGDVCLAYITKIISFNMKELKDFLKTHYEITDRVLLIILDPSGRPIKNPIIEYKL